MVTARPYETSSGMRLFAVPEDWYGVGVLAGGHVELVQRHLRFLVALGSRHHTGRVYRLYDGTGARVRPVLPPRDRLPELPAAWLDGLYRKPRVRGAPATADDVAAFARTYTFDECPKRLGRTVAAVRYATGPNETRPATHRALFIAARKARAGCYPWDRARDEIERAAREAYAERGGVLDEYDFARSVEHAVTQAMDLTADELRAWGEPEQRVDLDEWAARILEQL